MLSGIIVLDAQTRRRADAQRLQRQLHVPLRLALRPGGLAGRAEVLCGHAGQGTVNLFVSGDSIRAINTAKTHSTAAGPYVFNGYSESSGLKGQVFNQLHADKGKGMR